VLATASKMRMVWSPAPDRSGTERFGISCADSQHYYARPRMQFAHSPVRQAGSARQNTRAKIVSTCFK
jgi:hypothetical protein